MQAKQRREELPPDFHPLEAAATTPAQHSAQPDARRRELRKFGLVVGGAFLAIALYLAFRNRIRAPFYVCVSLGTILTLGGLLAPALLAPVQRGWMAMAHVLGWVNTRILLSIMFFAVLTPLSLLMRMLGRDALGRTFDKTRATYWQSRAPERDPERYRRQF